MRLATRLKRLHLKAAENRTGRLSPQVVVWLPYKQGGDPPGSYPSPGGGYVRIVHIPEAASSNADAIPRDEVALILAGEDIPGDAP